MDVTSLRNRFTTDRTKESSPALLRAAPIRTWLSVAPSFFGIIFQKTPVGRVDIFEKLA